MNKELLTRIKAADYLDVSTNTLDRIIRDGSLPFYRIRGQIRIDKTDIDTYIESCRCQMQPVGYVQLRKPRSTYSNSRPCAYVPGMKVV